MRKFLAVVKHEYKKIVVKWAFLLGTLLFPVIGAGFAIVPALIFSIKGEATRIAIVDGSDKYAPRIKSALAEDRRSGDAASGSSTLQRQPGSMGDDQLRSGAMASPVSFRFYEYAAEGKNADTIREELNKLATAGEIDAYLLIPSDLSDAGPKIEFRSRKAGDFVTFESIREAVNTAVRSQKLVEANIDESALRSITRPVSIDSKSIDEVGREKDSEMLLAASFVIGLMIYITLAIYGQVILGAVVEEKETRIAEILFSSATPFTLMLGKLVGVGLAGLTQMCIWLISLITIIGVLAVQTDLSPVLAGLPHISPLMLVYFLVYFLLGYFAYASIFALIGSAVTSVQEGGQFAFPPVMVMLVGFYFSFAVIRDPNSPIAFWISISPFFAPMTMPVRILAETPPLWQIALSVGVNILVIAFLVWLASRVYRVGMLMYGKRATVPELLKWISQA